MMKALTAVKILLIVTSHEQLGTTQERTGFWLEELAAPYQEFSGAGAQVDIASPRGGKAPADPRSTKEPSEAARAFLADAQAVKKLEHTLVLEGVKEEYDAYFVVGGHGVMWALATHAPLHRLLTSAYNEVQESEADDLGTRLAFLAGYEPLEGATVHRTLAGARPTGKVDPITGFADVLVRTHPPSLKRAAAIEALARKLHDADPKRKTAVGLENYRHRRPLASGALHARP